MEENPASLNINLITVETIFECDVNATWNIGLWLVKTDYWSHLDISDIWSRRRSSPKNCSEKFTFMDHLHSFKMFTWYNSRGHYFSSSWISLIKNELSPWTHRAKLAQGSLWQAIVYTSKYTVDSVQFNSGSSHAGLYWQTNSPS